MNLIHIAWLLGRPGPARRAPLLLTLSAYAVVTALTLIVVGGALSFRLLQPEAQVFYLSLAGLAVALLIVPLLVLGRSAAQLSARSQDRALASLRLMGATGAQVRTISVLQALAAAVLGAVGGVGLYFGLVPLVSLVRFQGSALGSALLVPVPVILVVLAMVAVLSVISSLIGLRRLVITPLAVRKRSIVPKPSWVRVVVVLLGLGIVYTLFTNLGVIAADAAVMIVVLILGMGLGLGILNLIGPWLVAKVAQSDLRSARTAAALLGARMILESPQQAWRQVSGVAMAAFVAVVGGSGAAMMQLTGEMAVGGWEDYLAADILTGVLLTLGVSFACVAASSAITQAAGTLDRADLYRGLDRLGMPAAVMNRARVRSVMLPTLTAAIGFGVASAVLVLPLAGMAVLLRPITVLVVLGTVAAGLIMVRLAIALASPRLMLRNRSAGGINAASA